MFPLSNFVYFENSISDETTDDFGQIPYETGCLVEIFFPGLNKDYILYLHKTKSEIFTLLNLKIILKSSNNFSLFSGVTGQLCECEMINLYLIYISLPAPTSPRFPPLLCSFITSSSQVRLLTGPLLQTRHSSLSPASVWKYSIFRCITRSCWCWRDLVDGLRG